MKSVSYDLYKANLSVACIKCMVRSLVFTAAAAHFDNFVAQIWQNSHNQVLPAANDFFNKWLNKWFLTRYKTLIYGKISWVSLFYWTFSHPKIKSRHYQCETNWIQSIKMSTSNSSALPSEMSQLLYE